MAASESGYWDFYQDNAGYWRWRFVDDTQHVIASDQPYDSSDECFQDAIAHGYSRFNEHRVTRAFD